MPAKITSIFYKGQKIFIVLSFILLCLSMPNLSKARSAYAPRQTGMEPPGGPKRIEVLPGGKTLSRTPSGGMGYTDAYGNTIDDVRPEEKKPPKRLRSGAYGSSKYKETSKPLPDPLSETKKPLWKFQ